MEHKETIIIPLIEGPRPIASYEEIKEVLGDKVREYKIYGVLPERFLGKSDSLVKGDKVDIIVQGETAKGVFKLNLKEPFETFTDMMEIQVLAVNKKSNTSKVIHKGRYKKSIEIPQAIAARAMKQTQADHLEIEIVFKGQKKKYQEGHPFSLEAKPTKGEEVESEKIEDKDTPYARIWKLESGTEGKIINKITFDRIVKNRKRYDIFVVDRGDYDKGSVGEVYVGKKPVFPQPEKSKEILKTKDKKEKEKYLTPLEYRILVYTLEKKGKPGDILVLIEQCWRAPETVKRLAETEEQNITTFREQTSGYRKAVGVVSSLLYGKLGVRLKTFGKKIYRFSKQVDFCLLEII